MNTDLPFLHGLSALRPLVGAHTITQLIASLGGTLSAWNATSRDAYGAGWTEQQCRIFFHHRETWDIDKEYAKLEESGIRIIPLSDSFIPNQLRHIHNPPIALYVRGASAPITAPRWIAIVGSRKATAYGKRCTSCITEPLSRQGFPIVSGLAYGIDAEAHKAAIGSGGITVAVLGSGADDASLYPAEHRKLGEDIVASGGSIVSEYCPGTTPNARLFPERNRLVAGFSSIVVVIEAAEKSGALITASLALHENREVGAVPGPISSPQSRGTNNLLRQGAVPITCAEDVLEALEMNASFAQSSRLPFPDHGSGHDKTTILSCMDAVPRAIDEITKHSTLPPHTVASTLATLETNGVVRNVGGKRYVKVT